MGRGVQLGNSSGFVFATVLREEWCRASASWLAPLGYAVMEVKNRSLEAFVHADDWPNLKHFIERCAETGEAKTEIEYRIRHKDGGWRCFVTALVPSEEGIGEPGTLLFVSRDVTALKSLEAEKVQDQAFMKTVLDFLPAIICVRDRNGRYLLANRRAEDFFGLTAASIIGKQAETISHNKDQVGDFLAYDREVIETGIQKHFPEQIVKDHAGHTVVFEVLMLPIDARNDRAVLFVARDNTDRYEMEGEMLQLRENLLHADRIGRGGEIVFSLAHELNQPLAAIMSNAQAAQLMLAGGKPDLKEIENILADIVKDDKRAENVIRHLRSFLKKRTPMRDKIDVNETVMEILKLIRTDSALKGISMTTAFSHNLPEIFADRVQVQQVVLNLVLNAEEAMMAQPEEARNVTVKTFRGNSETVIVSVCDTGPGIAPKNLDRLFQAQFTTKRDGMGMGLAICRSIMESHGGRIWAVNNPEGGATFSFSLPCAKDAGPNENRKGGRVP